MNLELIIKLAKLANNNPNDNEANAASRKVCRLIEEGKFQFSQNGTRTAAEKVGASSATNTGPWKYRPEYGKDYYKDINDMFRDIFGGRNKKYNPTDKQREYYNRPPPSNPDQDRKYSPPNWTGPNTREEKPKRPLQCKTCKKEVLTAFVGVPQMFECNKCIWQAYKESSK